MLTEVDTREVYGTDALVTLYLVENAAKRCYRVECVSHGAECGRWETSDAGEALDIFRHTFTRPDAPDLFNREGVTT